MISVPSGTRLPLCDVHVGLIVFILYSPFSHYPSIAALIVLRIQSDTVCLLAFALASTALDSAREMRTRSITALASPLASLGRPTFFGLGWLRILNLLHDERPYRS
jgi:hypothetical protein